MANRYYKSGATVWNSANSWSETSPIAPDNAGIPGLNDDVFFTATSNNTCTVATTIGLCKNFTTTGWTGTITLNVDLRVFGNIVTSSTTTVNGAGWFTIAGQTPAFNKTMTSNGVLFPNFQLGVGGPPAHTLTFNDILNVTNIRHAVANTITTNGSSVNVNGSMTIEAVAATWVGTTVYNLTGSGNGNFGMSSTLPSFGNTININKTGGGTITFLANVRLFGATFNYIAGTVDTTTSLFDLYGTNTVTSKNTGTGNEITFNNVRMGNAVGLATTTLLSNMKISGNLTVGSQAVKINTSNSSTVELDGNLFYNGGGNPGVGYFLGTSSITFKGNADTVIQGTNNAGTNALLVGINLIINKSSGRKVTLTPTTTSPKIYLVPGETVVNNPMSITVTSGSLDAAVGSTVVVGFANTSYTTTLTLNTGGNTVTFPNLNIEALNNQLNIN